MSGELPDDLRLIERLLERRARGEPAPALRSRVLCAVERELSSRRGGRLTWSYLSAVAAAVIIAANLAVIAGSVTRFDNGAHGADEVRQIARLIRQVVPEVEPAEAQRMALLMGSARGLLPVPLVKGRSIGIEQAALAAREQ